MSRFIHRDEWVILTVILHNPTGVGANEIPRPFSTVVPADALVFITEIRVTGADQHHSFQL